MGVGRMMGNVFQCHSVELARFNSGLTAGNNSTNNIMRNFAPLRNFQVCNIYVPAHIFVLL
jgi:hypothetical protein